MQNDTERFLSHVSKDAESGCWHWGSTIKRDGYGQFWLQGASHRAHRVSWVLFRGEIPQGKWVLHHCDTPRCVNPDHLWLGDNSENQIDCARKGRTNLQRHPEQSRFNDPSVIRRGSGSHMAKITEAQAFMIRELWKSGMTERMIGVAYGLRQTTVNLIRRGVTWKHVPRTREDASISRSEPI